MVPFLFVACDECTDCATKITEPRVEVMFINADSLAKLEALTTEIGQNQTSIQSDVELSQEVISVLVDSLTRLEDGIDTGNTALIPTRDAVAVELSLDSMELALLTDSLTVLDSLSGLFASAKSTINSGSLLLERLTNTANGLSVGYTDSMSTYLVALDISNTSSDYEFVIDEVSYGLQLSHENGMEIDTRRNLIVTIESFMVTNHDFDSIAPSNCLTQNCLVNETTLICYF